MMQLMWRTTFLIRAVILRALAAPRDTRGDVPGWVMITVMTAGLVSALAVIAGDRLSELLNAAFDSVS